MFVQRLLILGTLLQCLHYTICDHEQTYFIKAAEDSPCAAQPCLTLSEFIHNATKVNKAGVISLQFGVGNHELHSRLTFSNIKLCSMFSLDTNSTIACDKFAAGFTFQNVSMATLTNLTFISCGNSSRFYAVLQISQVSINISVCTFLHSRGRAIEAANATITTQNCTFVKSNAGVVIAEYNTTMHDMGSIYIHNTFSTDSSALLYLDSSTANYTNCTFHENVANPNMIHVQSGKLAIINCELAHNNGAELLTANESTITIFSSQLTHNFADLDHSLIKIGHATNISLSNSTLAYNVAKRRLTILHVSGGSIVESYHILTITNNTSYQKVSYNIMIIRDSKVKFGEVYYSNNTGCIHLMHSKATFTKKSEFQNHKQVKGPYSYSGAITSIASIIRFQGITTFCNNYSQNKGGAIYATASRVYTNGDTLFSNNKAKWLGGALYLDQSDFVCQKNCTFIGNIASKGGAIHATSSIITMGNDWNKFGQNKGVKSSLSFVSNSADEGGGIYLEANSKLRAPRGDYCTYELDLDNNVAMLGGAIFVNDYTNVCNHSVCFIQASSDSVTNNLWNGRIRINSTNENTTIYGGLLDRCTVDRTYSGKDFRSREIGFNYLKRTTKNAKIEDLVTSDPVRVCYCIGGEVNCSYTKRTMNVKRGETFKVSVAAVDQANHTVDDPIFIMSTKYYVYRLGIGQWVQSTHNGCTDLELKITSLNDSVKLILYPEGPCYDIGISKAVLNIKFKACTCPVGFQQREMQEDCICDCDYRINDLIKQCNHSSMTLLRQGDFWMNYINDTNKIDYLIYPHCPYDYCILSTNTISINLNVPNGVDAQCAPNRTGLLCSSCKESHSLSLGSSRCLSCPKDWPKLFAIMVLAAIASGILLVTIILALNLTVAVGTLNGLIFYANVMASNNIIYSSLSNSSFFSVFIDWLNLELGLDTCFYNGLDTYSKVWLQFAFPAYLITILFTIAILSKYSSKFTKLIGKRNPVATLATLILLSYMKFLRNIVHIFSIANLRYPDGSIKILWLPDANIEYLEGKHIPLFLMATAIIAIGLPYTVFLLTWQWLLQMPDFKLLKWIRYTRINLFMEANLAGYRPKQRYWSGLLLLIRVVFYLEVAYNNTNKGNTSLLTTGLIATCLLFLKAYGGKVYKNKMVDHLDTFIYLNLLVLSIAQLYSQNNKTGQMIVAKISASAAFLQLLLVLTYHTIKMLLEIPCLNRLNSSLSERVQRDLKCGEHPTLSYQEMKPTVSTDNIPTSTEIGLSSSNALSVRENRLKQEMTTDGVSRSLTTKWVESNHLREPLLQNEL